MKLSRCWHLLVTLLVITVSDCFAEINLVQDTSWTVEGVDAISATFTVTPTEGNLLIAAAGNRDGSAAPATPAGWTVLFSAPAGNPGQIVYYKVARASESSTVTVGPYPISSRRGLQLYEYSGLDTLNLLEDTATTSGSGTNVAFGDVTTIQECLIIACATINANTHLGTWSNSFEEQYDFVNAGAPNSKSTYAGAHRISMDGGTFSTTATSDSTGSWIGHIAAFNAAQNCACTVTTVADAGPGSLRECMVIANNCTGTIIEFNIPGPGNMSKGADSWWRISPTSELPNIDSRTTVIDGTTQTSSQGNTNSLGPEIEINGGSAGATSCFDVYKPNTAVKGLVINGFSSTSRAAININGSGVSGNTVHGCYLGTNATGDSAIANYNGVRLSTYAEDNDIGGSGAGEGNLISGNTGAGIYVLATCENNRFRGNLIGTNAACDTAIPNGGDGIYCYSNSGNTIGGSNSGEGNVLSGNVQYGVRFTSADNTILQGNWIGTDSSGTVAIPNTLGGVYFVTSDTATIGGTSAGAGNIISGNLGSGLVMAPLDNATIYGNMIGTGPTGTETGLGNEGDYSIRLANVTTPKNVKIGGLNDGEGNVIAGGAHSGVYVGIPGQDVMVAGNVIRDHGEHGVISFSDSLRIIGNLIHSNGLDGVRFVGTDTTTFIYHNTIHGNGDNGIEIGAVGAVIKNNIITGNASYGLRIDSGSVAEAYNLITDAITQPINELGRSNVSLDASDVNGDPMFNDTLNADYSLTECSSPAINSGADLGADQPDMNGSDPGLYTGSAPDIGAFESSCLSVLSVSVSNPAFTFGITLANQWLPPDSSSVINDGTIAENFRGRISQFTDGSNTWDIDPSSNGADSIRAQWSTVSNTGPWTDISAYGSDFNFATDVAVSDTVTIWFRMQAPVTTSSYNEYSSFFTVTAEAF